MWNSKIIKNVKKSNDIILLTKEFTNNAYLKIKDVKMSNNYTERLLLRKRHSLGGVIWGQRSPGVNTDAINNAWTKEVHKS